MCSQSAEKLVERGLDVCGEAGRVGVLAGDGVQGGVGDRVGVGFGDLVRVERVVAVADDQGGNIDRPPCVD
jgi:hypothetical protein